MDTKPKCLLITPPLLEPQTFYVATPILVGQLKNNGYDAKNLDLNIDFFKTILSENYINETKTLLEQKGISYDAKHIEYLLSNVEQAVEIYKKTSDNNPGFADAQETLQSVLEFISLPYQHFNMNKFSEFEHCFDNFDFTYQYIKAISFDRDCNIFIDYFEKKVKEIQELSVDFIGITIPFPGTIIPAFTLARLLKENTNIKIVLGGNYIKNHIILDNPEILDIFCDAVLIGDGEESIVELVKSVESGKEQDKISGLIYKNKENKILCNEPKPVTKMNDIANMSFDGLNLKEYMTKDPAISIMISKGCYWGKCNFCSLAPKYGHYRIKSPEKTVADIKELQEKHQIKSYFFFQDDSIPPAYLSRLADEILKQNLHIYYFIFGRLEKEFTRELLEKTYKSGLRSVYWGLESKSQKILDDMNKGIKLENVHRILKDAYEIGISSMLGIILNFPTETMKEFRETIKFLETIEQYATISPGEFGLMKNSYMQDRCKDFGLEITDYNKNDLNYCLSWKDHNSEASFRKKKWEFFCEFLKESNFRTDKNKNL